jgi:hypothetical protein
MGEKSVTLENNTDRPWVMAVFQTLPGSSGLDSVSWKQATAAESGSGSVSWTGALDVVIASYDESKRLYKPSQKLDATVGSAWKIVFDSGIQQLRQDGQAPIGTQIKISNASGLLANPGFGMDDSGAVYQRALLSGAAALFNTPPTFWVSLFDAIQPGKVIQQTSLNVKSVAAGPWQLQFPAGLDNAMLTAWLDGATLRTKLTYS